VKLQFNVSGSAVVTLKPAGPVIEGWQRYEGEFTAPVNATQMTMSMVNSNAGSMIYFDDIRIHPSNANMKSYAYDPVNLRLVAEMDANNYATQYEYDEEGSLIRTKAETKEGIKTINETRSFKQRNVRQVQ
jgi:YD repeat-containing protein